MSEMVFIDSSNRSNGKSTRAKRNAESVGRIAKQRHRHDPLRGASCDSISRRSSMAIKDMLNPSEDAFSGSRSPSYERSSDEEASLSMASSQKVQPATKSTVQRAHDKSSTPEERRSTSTESGGGADSPPVRTRPFRPAYEYEHMMFLWFHDIDLQLRWDEFVPAFKATWPEAPRDKAGMQCKLYRLLAQYGVPPKREQLLGPEGNKHAYGMWARMGHRYPWMDRHAHKLPGYGPPGPPYHQSPN